MRRYTGVRCSVLSRSKLITCLLICSLIAVVCSGCESSRPPPSGEALTKAAFASAPEPFESISCKTELRNIRDVRGFLDQQRNLEQFANAMPMDLGPKVEPLALTGPDYSYLIREGRVVWGAIVQANSQLFMKTNDLDLPAQVIWSNDPYFDGNPIELIKIADRVYSLKGTTPSIPELKTLSMRVTDEMYYAVRDVLPKQLTGGREVYLTTIRVLRKFLPTGAVEHRAYPILVAPNSPRKNGLVPYWLWPTDIRFLETLKLHQMMPNETPAAEGTKLGCDLRGTIEPATVSKLPFYKKA